MSAKPTFDPKAPRLTLVVVLNGKEYEHTIEGNDLKAQTVGLLSAFQDNFKSGISFYSGDENISYPVGTIVRLPRSFTTLDPTITDPDGNWSPRKILTGPEVHAQAPRGENVQLGAERMSQPPPTRALTEGWKPTMATKGVAAPSDSPNSAPIPPEVAEKLGLSPS
jgi:hypothetical protein